MKCSTIPLKIYDATVEGDMYGLVTFIPDALRNLSMIPPCREVTCWTGLVGRKEPRIVLRMWPDAAHDVQPPVDVKISNLGEVHWISRTSFVPAKTPKESVRGYIPTEVVRKARTTKLRLGKHSIEADLYADKNARSWYLVLPPLG